MKINLPNVTLLGIDCLDPYRLQEALNISELGINFGASKLLSSKKINDPRLIEIEDIDSIEKYSKFCIADLYKYVDTDFVLIVQYDGFVLNPESWTDEFLDYDYIGAPWRVNDWYVKEFNFPQDLKGEIICGNGGFSLRSKKLLELSSKFYKEGIIKTINPEDMSICAWYRKCFVNEGMKFAPQNVAEKFSIEGRHVSYKKQFGFHSFRFTDIDDWIIHHTNFKLMQQINRNSVKVPYQ